MHIYNMIKKIIIIIVVIFIGGMLYWNNLKAPVNSKGEDVKFTINKGETADKIISNLKNNNLIKSSWLFKYYLKTGHLNLISGEYILNPSMSLNKILNILTSGRAISQEKNIRIIEGWTIDDINKVSYNSSNSYLVLSLIYR